MTARTEIQAAVTTLIALSATRPVTFDAAGYTDTDLTWTTIGEVETVGEHGPQAEVITFTSVNDGVVQKLKGSVNHGTMNLTIGHVPSDAGQILALAAMSSQNPYSVRITYPLAGAEVTAEKHYLDALITSFRWIDGTANDVRKVQLTLEVCAPTVVVSAT
jgi:hypothetical protein